MTSYGGIDIDHNYLWLMDCCLKAPSHYIEQSWHIIKVCYYIHLRAISQGILTELMGNILLNIVSLTFESLPYVQESNALTHWGRVTHICVGNLTIIGSDNGLSPGRRQAITWTNVGILLIGPLGTNLSEILIETHTVSFKKIHLKMSSGKWRPFCLCLNVLKHN